MRDGTARMNFCSSTLLYSPECVEGKFCEVCRWGFSELGSRDPNVCGLCCPAWREVSTLGNTLTDQAVDKQQYDRSHRSHQDRPHVESRSSRAAKDPEHKASHNSAHHPNYGRDDNAAGVITRQDRKSTRLNSSHANISYAVFCLKKKKKTYTQHLTA